MRQGIALGLMLLALLLSCRGRAETILFLGDLHLTADESAMNEVLNAVQSAADGADALVLSKMDEKAAQQRISDRKGHSQGIRPGRNVGMGIYLHPQHFLLHNGIQ